MSERIRALRSDRTNGGGPLSASDGKVYLIPVEPHGWLEMEPWSDYVGEGRDGITVGATVEEPSLELGTTLLHAWASELVAGELRARGLALRVIEPVAPSGVWAKPASAPGRVTTRTSFP